MPERQKPIVTELALADALDRLVNLIEELRADADLRVEITTDETQLVKFSCSSEPHACFPLRRNVGMAPTPRRIPSASAYASEAGIRTQWSLSEGASTLACLRVGYDRDDPVAVSEMRPLRNLAELPDAHAFKPIRRNEEFEADSELCRRRWGRLVRAPAQRGGAQEFASRNGQQATPHGSSYVNCRSSQVRLERFVPLHDLTPLPAYRPSAHLNRSREFPSLNLSIQMRFREAAQLQHLVDPQQTIPLIFHSKASVDRIPLHHHPRQSLMGWGATAPQWS